LQRPNAILKRIAKADPPAIGTNDDPLLGRVIAQIAGIPCTPAIGG
jgi:hypothetical protein